MKIKVILIAIVLTAFALLAGSCVSNQERAEYEAWQEARRQEKPQQAAARQENPNMVRIQGGTFMMGYPVREQFAPSSISLQHQVTLSAFYMSKYEVTQKEWFEVMGTTIQQQRVKTPQSSRDDEGFYGIGDNYPMYFVSWYEAIEYCNRRSQREGLTPVYTISGSGDSREVTWNRNANGYRLPTEAEWEYACRAGTTTPFYTGNSISARDANWDSLSWEAVRVGSYPPNPWGLYDMMGNVREWCWDKADAYPEGPQTNPVGPDLHNPKVQWSWGRIVRGGSWFSNFATDLRSFDRGSGREDRGARYTGFRIARNGQ